MSFEKHMNTHVSLILMILGNKVIMKIVVETIGRFIVDQNEMKSNGNVGNTYQL